MSLKSEILEELRRRGGYVSGEELARSLNKSRTAVWKAVNALRSEGYPVEAHTKKGYRLCGDTDVLNAEEILRLCKTKIKVFYLDSVDSTNNYAKSRLRRARKIFSLLRRRSRPRAAAGRAKPFFHQRARGSI